MQRHRGDEKNVGGITLLRLLTWPSDFLLAFWLCPDPICFQIFGSNEFTAKQNDMRQAAIQYKLPDTRVHYTKEFCCLRHAQKLLGKIFFSIIHKSIITTL